MRDEENENGELPTEVLTSARRVAPVSRLLFSLCERIARRNRERNANARGRVRFFFFFCMLAHEYTRAGHGAEAAACIMYERRESPSFQAAQPFSFCDIDLVVSQ